MAKEVKKEQAAKNAKQSKGEAKAKKGGEQVTPKGWIPNLQKEYKERIMTCSYLRSTVIGEKSSSSSTLPCFISAT